MDALDFNNLPNILATQWSALIQALTSFREEHSEMLDRCLKCGTTPNDPRDHLIAAALWRSTALIEGFLLLVDTKNRFAAVPLIRLQLDSAMRIHACSRVANPQDFVRHMLEGGEPKKFSQHDGEQLSDSFLHKQLTEQYPTTSDLYKDTNGYIHLSNHHLFGIFNFEKLRDGELIIADYKNLPPWNEEQRKEAIVSMLWATDVLTKECKVLMKLTNG